MKIEKLNCPSCGSPLTGDFSPNQRIECHSCGTPLLLTHLDAENPIFCPECNTLNPDEIRFCVNCGSNLKIACNYCHTQNRIDATFCARCGVHLQRAMTKRFVLEESVRRLRQERLEAFKEKEERQKYERLQRLLDALDEPENHEFAIYQINQMGLEAIEALIDTLLNDHDPDARYGSARALGQICSEKEVKALIKGRAAKALITGLADQEPAVRYWAAEALGRCQSRVAIDPLAGLLNDPHEGVRLQAQNSLQEIGGERVQKILEQAQSKGFLGWLRGK